MSYLNINYSTLEDAWGSNFEKSKKKIKQSNPLCKLYNNQNAHVYKPYKTVQDSTHIKPIYEDDDYTKYYGYQDGRPFSKKSNKLAKYKLKFPYEKPKIASNVYVSDEDDDTNDVYLDEEVDRVVRTLPPTMKKTKQIAPIIKKKSKKYIPVDYSFLEEEDDEPTIVPIKKYNKHFVIEEEEEDDYDRPDIYDIDAPSSNNAKSLLKKKIDQSFLNRRSSTENLRDDALYTISPEYDSDDDFEEYLLNKKGSVDNEEEYNTMLRTIYDEEADEFPEEEDSYKIKHTKSKRYTNERVFLDLILYTISGILLIFIMEQFIQIGTKIKTPL